MNYRPWGYEPHGLTWLPYPANSHPNNYPNLINLSPHPQRYHYLIISGYQTRNGMPRNTIPQQRIQTLYKIAQETIHTEPTQARRYVSLLRRIAQRTRTKIPQHIRTGICKKCNTPLIPGYNSTTRIRQTREPHITTTCHTCGNITRRPIKRKQK